MKKSFLEDWEKSFLKIDKTMVCGFAEEREKNRWSHEGLVFLNREKQIMVEKKIVSVYVKLLSEIAVYS